MITSTPKRILFLPITSDETPSDPDFIRMLRERGNEVETRAINQARSYSLILQALRLTSDIKRFDLVIAQEYFSSFGVALRAILSLTASKTKIAVTGFNVSRRYLVTGSRLVNRTINRIFSRFSLIVVHSRAESSLFCRAHDLDPNRIALSLWGYDLPRTFHRDTAKPVAKTRGRYICMVGRNNRDFAILTEAIRGTSIRAIYVASRATDTQLDTTEHIEILYDIPFDDCLGIIDNSALSVILLKNEKRGAGHITAVSAMLLGKAQVFSDADVLQDYLVANRHGIAVPLNDAAAARQAILQLLDDQELAERYGRHAREFALKYLTNIAAQQRIFTLMNSVLEETPVDLVDPEWQRQMSNSRQSN